MAGRTSPTARLAAGVVALLLNVAMAEAQQPALQPQGGARADTTAIAIDNKSIGGVVTSRFGPEAGVWVIAETKDLGTRFAKIVVTDERGRYVIPDLPKANYRVWVRGYGLVNSEKVAAEPGKTLDLTAVVAPSLAAAAQYYPAIYWASMIRIPDKSRFPGTGDKGNGIPENFKTQEQWLNFVKTNGCGNCHQIGNYATRTIPAAFGHFEISHDAWMQRLWVGPAGHDMVNFITQLMTPDGGQLAALADWTDRIKAGELPSRSPPRPVGVERNLVVTVRDWLDPKHYLHDLTTTDRRHPTVNAYGPIYGDTELSSNSAGARPGAQHQNDDPAAGARGHAEFGAGQPGGRRLGLLGHGADLGQQGQRAYLGDGSGWPRLLRGAEPFAERHSGLLQERLVAALGAALSA